MCAALAALALPTAAVPRAEASVHPTATQSSGSDTPLSVALDQLTPSVIPAHGEIHVSGTVTNHDTSTWTQIDTYAFISEEPMTTSAELAEAAQTDPTTSVGDRVIDATHHDLIASLDPGQTRSFSFSVPRKLLAQTIHHRLTSGVYWFGVHALGTGPDGHDDSADGRARTFLPLVPQRETGQLNVVLLSQDTDAAKVAPFARQRNLRTVPYTDADMQWLPAVTTTLPTTILYGSNGREVWRVMGERDWTSAESAAALAQAR